MLAVHGVARTKALVVLVAFVETIAGLDAVRWTREPGPTVRVAAFGWGDTHPATGSSLREAYDAGRLQKGKLVVMPAFGAGMAWGHLLLRW